MTHSAPLLPSARPGLPPGFADPVFEAQSVFRSLMLATAYPGTIVALQASLTPPSPFDVATAGVCLTLLDLETTLFLDPAADTPETRAWLAFHCGAPVVSNKHQSRFAVGLASLAQEPLDAFNLGEPEYPDRSTTVIVQVPSFTDGPSARWRGPGIQDSVATHIDGLPCSFWENWGNNGEVYPLGIDMIFTCGKDVIALPRAIRVEA